MARYRLSAAAQADIIEILAWTYERFGEDACLRYQRLIVTAIRDIADQPDRAGGIDRPELGAGVRSWHLRLSRERARTDAGVVQRPRHFLLYRRQRGVVVVGRILHDTMDPLRHSDD